MSRFRRPPAVVTLHDLNALRIGTRICLGVGTATAIKTPTGWQVDVNTIDTVTGRPQ